MTEKILEILQFLMLNTKSYIIKYQIINKSFITFKNKQRFEINPMVLDQIGKSEEEIKKRIKNFIYLSKLFHAISTKYQEVLICFSLFEPIYIIPIPSSIYKKIFSNPKYLRNPSSKLHYGNLRYDETILEKECRFLTLRGKKVIFDAVEDMSTTYTTVITAKTPNGFRSMCINPDVFQALLSKKLITESKNPIYRLTSKGEKFLIQNKKEGMIYRPKEITLSNWINMPMLEKEYLTRTSCTSRQNLDS